MRKSAWICTLSAAMFFHYDFIQLNILNSIHQALIQEFSLSSTEFGNLASIYLSAQTLAMFACGYVLDTFPIRKVILYGMSLCVLATFAGAYANSIEMLIIARALAGLTGAFCFLSSVLIATTWFEASKMSTVVGVVVTMGMLGGVVAQSPVEYLVSNYGWRQAMLINAIFGCIILAFMYIFVHQGPIERPLKKQNIFTSIVEVIKQSQNFIAGMYTALMNLVIFVLGAVWGNHYLITVQHLDSSSAALVITQLFIGSIIGAPLWGFIVDWTAKRRLCMLLGSFFSIYLMLVLIMVENLSLHSLTAIFLLLGLSTSTQVLSYPHIALSNSKNNIGMAESFAALFILGLGAISQSAMGWLMDIARLKRHSMSLEYISSDFNTAIWAFPCIIFLASICAWQMRTPKQKS